MDRLQELEKRLKRGRVYRRHDLAKWSKSIDRHLNALVEEDILQKLSFYNALGVGASQLYNKRTVYSHKQHGDFK